MDISVIWIPDEIAGERLIELRKPLAQKAGVSPGYYPHLSLGVYYQVPFEPLDTYTRQFALRIHQFSVRYTHIRQLAPGVLAVGAENKGAVRSLYNEYHKEFDEYADEWTKKSCGNYTPHSTLLNITPSSDAQLPEFNMTMESFEARMVKIQLSRFYVEGRYEILSSYDLFE